jgi:transposase-like protein
MASEKLAISLEDVQGLFTDKDGLRKLVEESVQKIIEAEFEKHMGRKRYERGKGRATHRNGYKPRMLYTRVGTLHLRVPHGCQATSRFAQLGDTQFRAPHVVSPCLHGMPSYL